MADTLTRRAPLLTALLAVLALLAVPATAQEADAGVIGPGVQMVTDGAQCTANFIFTDGVDMFIGYAAHCAGEGAAATDTDGCAAESKPVGETAVDIENADHPGTLVYSSWATMNAVGETDDDTCAFNDFAVVEIDPRDHDKISPTMPFWGGPDGQDPDTAVGEDVYTYGNSSLRLGVEALSPKQGVSLGQAGDGWTHNVYTVSPGIPGDSGSGFLDENGEAFGVLVTVQVAPLAGSNGVTDLTKALDYAATAGGFDVDLVTGEQDFAPIL